MHRLRLYWTSSWFSPTLILSAAMPVIVMLASVGASAQEPFEGWHLEPGIADAHLVMVARVDSISRLTVVEGAKTDVAWREYRFQPVLRLKGIFQREQLSMTAADLGFPDGGDVAPPLEEGEFRVLILAQQQGRFMGCVSAAPGARTFDERVPLVAGPDDPLVSVVETLIQVADSRSRRQRARLLIERLEGINGVSAIPLLTSLQLRADWADNRALASVVRLGRDPSPAVRRASLELLRDMLTSQTLADDSRKLNDVAQLLRDTLNSGQAVTDARLSALAALGHLLESTADIAWAREFLITQISGAQTHAERSAAAAALARIVHPQAIAAMMDALAKLPLDEPTEREAAYARAAVRLDSEQAERILLARLERSIAARQSLEAEIQPLGRMRTRESLPLLLAAAGQQNLSTADRHRIAWALGRLGDDQAVPVLIGWLRGDDYQLKQSALAALENVDSPLAAREARPLLKSEPHLPFKLRLARLLARHGIADGFALATEHLADADQTPAATLVLVALDDPRTSSDLEAILAARPDRRWLAAAVAGLAAIGDPAAQRQLLDILADDRHPLAAAAAEAAGLTAESQVLVPLVTLAQSRNSEIALASLVAMQRFMSGVRSSPRGLAAVDQEPQDRVEDEINSDADQLLSPAADIPAQTQAAIAKTVAALAADVYVDSKVRREALAVARRVRGTGYDELLSELADQAELEGTPLLAEVKAERTHGMKRVSGER